MSVIEAYDKWARFLETTPPNTRVKIPSLLVLATRLNATLNFISPTLIELHCEKEGGTRKFETNDEVHLSHPLDYSLITYECRNCKETEKTFAVAFVKEDRGKR